MLSLTPLAVEKITEYLKEKEEYQDKGLRIFIQGSSCSGYSYGFGLDDQKKEDSIIIKDNIKIIVDPKTLPIIEGSEVDFIQDENQEGFIINNPNLTNIQKIKDFNAQEKDTCCKGSCNCNCNG